jgi:hypothetical protein
MCAHYFSGLTQHFKGALFGRCLFLAHEKLARASDCLIGNGTLKNVMATQILRKQLEF